MFDAGVVLMLMAMFVFVLVKVLFLSGRSSNQQCNGKLNGTPCLKHCPEPDCRQVVRIRKKSFICKVIKTKVFSTAGALVVITV